MNCSLRDFLLLQGDDKPGHFIKGKLFRVLLWPLSALAIAAIGWFAAYENLNTYKNVLEQNAIQQAGDHAKIYAENLERTLEALDQITRHVRLEWHLSEGRLRLEKMTDIGLFPPDSESFAAIIDENGSILTATAQSQTPVNFSDREYFQVQKHGAIDGLYIGQPIHGRITKRDVVPLAHRLTNESGEFAGVVILTARKEYFVSYYDLTIFGDHGFLAMVGDDGIVRSLRTGKPPDSKGAPLLPIPPVFEVKTAQTILDGDEWFSDGRSRYVGWDSLSQYPITAVVGLDQSEVLAPYWSRRESLINNGLIATVCLGIFTLVAMVLSARLARRDVQLRSAQAAYRMATESGQEGFYILHPLFKEPGLVIDFQIVDCNERAAKLFLHRKEELLGKTIAALYASASPDRILKFLQEVWASGLCSVEWEMAGNDPLNSKWVAMRGVRSEDNIALTVRDVTETKEHVAELKRQSDEDRLTGLPNRKWVQDHLPTAISHASAANTLLAVLFIDLDGFKSINDTLGHEAGDELLRMASQRLKVAVRPHDYVVRLGGDEFVVVLDDVLHKDDAEHVATRIQHAFQDGYKLARGVYSVGASIGISIFPQDGGDAETLLRHADIAMYSAKTSGKQRYRFFDEKLYESLFIRRNREEELRYAIANDQLLMYYQPRIDMRSGAITSMEALVRWAHPTLGLLGPSEFIPMAEETGLILPIGELVIKKVCAQVGFWHSRSRDLVPVSINVSSKQFEQVDVAMMLSSAMARHNVPPQLIEIEITESSMMGDEDNIRETITSLQKIGIKMLVDDFGTGYSSLSQLQRMEFDVIKVDRAFTSQLDKTKQGVVLFRAIITMAHALGMRVVAEGVENVQQIKVLQSLNCDEMQGF